MEQSLRETYTQQSLREKIHITKSEGEIHATKSEREIHTTKKSERENTQQSLREKYTQQSLKEQTPHGPCIPGLNSWVNFFMKEMYRSVEVTKYLLSLNTDVELVKMLLYKLLRQTAFYIYMYYFHKFCCSMVCP